MIHMVCDEFVEVSILKKILFGFGSLIAISTKSSDSWSSCSKNGSSTQ